MQIPSSNKLHKLLNERSPKHFYPDFIMAPLWALAKTINVEMNKNQELQYLRLIASFISATHRFDNQLVKATFNADELYVMESLYDLGLSSIIQSDNFFDCLARQGKSWVSLIEMIVLCGLSDKCFAERLGSFLNKALVDNSLLETMAKSFHLLSEHHLLSPSNKDNIALLFDHESPEMLTAGLIYCQDLSFDTGDIEAKKGYILTFLHVLGGSETDDAKCDLCKQLSVEMSSEFKARFSVLKHSEFWSLPQLPYLNLLIPSLDDNDYETIFSSLDFLRKHESIVGKKLLTLCMNPKSGLALTKELITDIRNPRLRNYIDRIEEHPQPELLANALNMLARQDLLKRPYVQYVLEHAVPDKLAFAYEKLRSYPEFEAICSRLQLHQFDEPNLLALIYKAVEESTLDTDSTLAWLKNYPEIFHEVYYLGIDFLNDFHKTGLWSRENLRRLIAISNDENRYHLRDVMKALSKVPRLDPILLTAISLYPQRFFTFNGVRSITYLVENKLLNLFNLSLILKRDVDSFDYYFFITHRLLTNATFPLIFLHPDIDGIKNLLSNIVAVSWNEREIPLPIDICIRLLQLPKGQWQPIAEAFRKAKQHHVDFRPDGIRFIIDHVAFVLSVKEVIDNSMPFISQVYELIRYLDEKSLLTMTWLKRCLSHAHPFWMVNGIDALKEGKLLTEGNLQLIEGYEDPKHGAEALVTLDKHEQLIPSIREEVLAHERPHSLAAAYGKLKKLGLFNKTHIDRIRKSPYPVDLVNRYPLLLENDLFVDDELDFLASHPDPHRGVIDYILLIKNGIARTYVNLIHEENYIRDVLYRMDEGNFLNASTFARLLPYVSCFKNRDLLTLISRIPDHLFTRNLIEGLLIRCRQANGDSATAINFMVGFIEERERLLSGAPQLQINRPQSTHTVSVHASVSASASRLLKRYDRSLQSITLDTIIVYLKSWSRNCLAEVMQNPEALQFYSAKLLAISRQQKIKTSAKLLAISRQQKIKTKDRLKILSSKGFIKLLSERELTLTAAFCALETMMQPYYTFEDPASGVSTLTMLGLCYLALQDALEMNPETVTEQSVYDTALDCLYEIGRGYNLESGVDDLGRSEMICTSGAFNKLVHKLQSLHPDVFVIYIASETVEYKFPIIIKEAAIDFLKLSINSQNMAQCLYTVYWLNKLQGSALKKMWNYIEPKISTRLNEEFADYFANKKSDLDKLLTCGQKKSYLFSSYQKDISNSRGCQQYYSSLLVLNSSLFASQSETKLDLEKTNSHEQSVKSKGFLLIGN